MAALLVTSCNEQVKTTDKPEKPDCVTQRVSEISNPTRETDFLVHVCGDKVTTEFVNKNIEADNVQAIAKQQSKETWEEASAWADLNAQKSMANSTFWIMLATLAGIFIGGSGLYYLKKTFDSTNRTAIAAEQSERAYLCPKVEFRFRKYKSGAEDKKWIYVTPIIENLGNTPAKAVSCTVKIGVNEPDWSAIKGHPSYDGKEIFDQVIGAKTKLRMGEFEPGDSDSFLRTENWIQSGMKIWFSIEYKCIFSNEPLKNISCIQLSFEGMVGSVKIDALTPEAAVEAFTSTSTRFIHFHEEG